MLSAAGHAAPRDFRSGRAGITAADAYQHMHSANEIFERVFSEEEKAGLRGEVFVNRELLGVDLASADLRAAHFKSTLLDSCDLRRADLRGARFILCDFNRVNLTGAVCEETRFDGSTFVDTVGVDDRLRALIEGGGGTFLPSCASRR